MKHFHNTATNNRLQRAGRAGSGDRLGRDQKLGGGPTGRQEKGVDIGRATEVDLDGILELQAANQPERGGMLSASLPRSRIAQMMRAMPLIVARCNGRIIGFLMTSTREMSADIPIIRAMLAAYPGADDAYVYGPVCVSAEERGSGVAQAMFAELQRLEPGREGVLFIRRDNPASLRSHAKMGMHEVAGFVFSGNDYAVLSYVGLVR
jgi:predicted GNAT superfamily acetyltransferase